MLQRARFVADGRGREVSITASSNSMATASNDGSVKLWSFDGAGMGWWGDGLVGIG